MGILWLIHYINGDELGSDLDSEPNPMATLYYAEHVHIPQTRTQTPTSYFCTGQESESAPDNVNKPLTCKGHTKMSFQEDKTCLSLIVNFISSQLQTNF